MEKYYNPSKRPNEERQNEEGSSSRKQSRVEFNPNDIVNDPGLRKPITEFDVSIRDQVIREYVLRGSCQPHGHSFPKVSNEKDSRCFLGEWFKTYPWLEYSITKDAAFCLCCYLFKSSGDDAHRAFTVNGMRDWRKGHFKFRKHIGVVNSAHRYAMNRFRDYSCQRQSISHCFQAHGTEALIAYRKRLTAVLDVTRYLLKQGLAFRGHDEGFDSIDKGNYLELVDWYCKRSDDVAKVMNENAPGNCKLTSPKVQKELSRACAGEVTDVILKDLGDCTFSILVDEARDSSIKEQMGVVLRYVNKEGCVLERFLGIVHVSQTKAIVLMKALVDLFETHNLSFSRLRGQGYDGASNMRGEFNGLKALILNENSSARYVHCFSHQLQLVVVSVAYSTQAVGEFFGYLVAITNLVGVSCSRKDKLLEIERARIVQALENGEIVSGKGKNQVTSLRRPGDTRWGSHRTTILRFITMWPSIIKVLLYVYEEAHSDVHKSTAKGSIDRMECFEFVFSMFLMKHLLGVTHHLSLALQQRDQNIVMAVRMMKTMKDELQEFRDGGFEILLDEVNTFCVKHEITLDVMENERRIRYRSRRSGEMFTNLDFYRVDIFLKTVDRMILEMNERFSESSTELLTCMACLDPRDSFSMFNGGKLLRLAEMYPNDFSLFDRVELEQELKAYIRDVKADDDFIAIKDFGSLARKMVRSRRNVIFPLVYRLIELALIVPVATASVERVFSAMKSIKTDLRNRIGDEWLNDVMTVYIEKDIFVKIDNEPIMQRYQRLDTRKFPLIPLVSSSTSSVVNVRE